MVLLIGYALYYPYWAMSGTLDFAFFEPERMTKSRFSGGIVENETRWIWLAMWTVPILGGIYACVAAIYATQMVRMRCYFDVRFASAIFHLGVGTIISLVADIVATSFSRKVLSLHNPSGQHDLWFRFHSEEWGLILCGVGFCALGWVLREAVKIAEENDGFV